MRRLLNREAKFLSLIAAILTRAASSVCRRTSNSGGGQVELLEPSAEHERKGVRLADISNALEDEMISSRTGNEFHAMTRQEGIIILLMNNYQNGLAPSKRGILFMSSFRQASLLV
jgi:hypothetical protein